MVGNLFNNGGLPARIEAKNAPAFTAPSKELETRIKHGKFRHDGNSCLRWQASNVVVSRRVDGSILPKKETAESDNKIDAIDAIIRSISGWLKVVPPQKQYQLLILGRR
jgi:phage terminase large subunit-like protein